MVYQNNLSPSWVTGNRPLSPQHLSVRARHICLSHLLEFYHLCCVFLLRRLCCCIFGGKRPWISSLGMEKSLNFIIGNRKVSEFHPFGAIWHDLPKITISNTVDEKSAQPQKKLKACWLRQNHWHLAFSGWFAVGDCCRCCLIFWNDPFSRNVY